MKSKNTHNKLYFETSYLGENVKQSFSKKVGQNGDIFGLLYHLKNHDEISKVAQSVRIAKSGHPD